jgi:DNA helicase-2/ATP-dependent DNA helicase PcrA
VLEGLTEPQRRAVLCTEGPLLVLAGPGSGKTRVITRRIAWLIECGIPPWQILALTFTNKAAAEMRERVAGLLGEGAVSRGLTVTTFHALCARLLRRYADHAGLPPDFAIMDTADQAAVMKKAIAEAGLSTSNFPPRSVLARISAAKNDLVDAEAFAAAAGDFSSRTTARLYRAYDRAMRRAGGVDFDDLLLLTARLLRTDGAVRDACRGRWRYLLIDEYQDTNRAQFVIASLLAGRRGEPGDGAEDSAAAGGGRPNICVVGDPDQSIYAWRGADISNILQFEEQYPGATVIPLGENFRSTRPILAAADALIRHNTRRKHKDLFTARAGGEKVEVVHCHDEHHEAAVVLDWLRERRSEGDDGPAWKDMAVFYRTNALSRVMEDALRGAGVPYRIVRGTAFYQREEIRHAIAYLRVVANPADAVSMARIINTPARGIGDATWARIEGAAADLGLSATDALRRAASGGVPDLGPRAQAAVRKFAAMLDGWTGAGTFMGADAPGSLADLVGRVVRESGLEAMYRAGGTEADRERLENLDELVSSAADFEAAYEPLEDPGADFDPAATAGAPALLTLLRAYLEQVTLVADADAVDPDAGAVTLMTLHAAKGLEFGCVAIIGLEEGCLPHVRAAESPGDVEEERRLLFVGITRAMRRLLITSARYRTTRGIGERTIPSRFLGELPREWVRQVDRAEPGEAGDSARGGRPLPLPVGATVRHPQFGLGRVEAVTGGVNARAEIAFRDVGRKTLVLEYARLQVVDAAGRSRGDRMED